MHPVVKACYQRFARFHRTLYRVTGGWLGHHLTVIPALLLTTTGRRSGQPRAITLTYVLDGTRPVVVASNYGSDHPPAWLLNVDQQPTVEVWQGRRHRTMTATVVRPADREYHRLWRLANRGDHGRYDRYQAGTGRPIPMVTFTPDPAP